MLEWKFGICGAAESLLVDQKIRIHGHDDLRMMRLKTPTTKGRHHRGCWPKTFWKPGRPTSVAEPYRTGLQLHPGWFHPYPDIQAHPPTLPPVPFGSLKRRASASSSDMPAPPLSLGAAKALRAEETRSSRDSQRLEKPEQSNIRNNQPRKDWHKLGCR